MENLQAVRALTSFYLKLDSDPLARPIEVFCRLYALTNPGHRRECYSHARRAIRHECTYHILAIHRRAQSDFLEAMFDELEGPTTIH